MSKLKDLTGKRFGNLTVIKKSHLGNNRQWWWNCKCDCGTYKPVSGYKMRQGEIKSCGCKQGAYSHGKSRHRLYQVWNGMIQRCTNTNSVHYKDYGARGIKVCEHWLVIDNFINDMLPLFVEGLELDRIDNDGNYELENCRWVSKSKNMKNRRTASKHQSDVDFVIFDKQKNKWFYDAPFLTKDQAEKFACSVKETYVRVMSN